MSEESATFERFSTVRNTVARRCREYYHRRLERTEVLQRRWSVYTDEDVQATNTQDSPDDKRSDLGSDASDSLLFRKCLESSFKSSELSSLPSGNDSGHASDSSESPPTDFPKGTVTSDSSTSVARACFRPRSSLDIAMDNLRKEITSLIAQDNDLFRQLLSLNDSIAELRVQQEKNLSLWDGDYDSEHESLESISDEETTVSPASTLSSCCSSHHLDSSSSTPLDWPKVLPTETGRQRSKSSVCRTVVPSEGCTSRQRTRSVLCLRCHGKGAAPLYRRRAMSSSNLLWRQASRRHEMDSYDSGIQIHSDSDHEIFV